MLMIGRYFSVNPPKLKASWICDEYIINNFSSKVC
jgi:hypothetical protein